MRRSLQPLLNTLRGEARFENSIAAATLLGLVLLCHYVVMDFHCFRVLLYDCLGHGWDVTRVLPDNLALERVPGHS